MDGALKKWSNLQSCRSKMSARPVSFASAAECLQWVFVFSVGPFWNLGWQLPPVIRSVKCMFFSRCICKAGNVFAKTMPSTLLMRGNQLVIGTTQDETNIENEALPFRVVLHAPPVVLNATPPGFLLPHFDFNNKQYALCAASKIDQLNASVPDARFHVVPHAVQVMGRDCLHHPIMQKSFRAERTNSCKYCSWYIVADQDDVQATLSPEACVLEAIDLNDPVALKKILSDFSSAFLRAKGKTCNVLQKVIRLERWELLPDVAKHFDVDCHGCKETPLGVAAAEGRVEALKRLLAKDQREGESFSLSQEHSSHSYTAI